MFAVSIFVIGPWGYPGAVSFRTVSHLEMKSAKLPWTPVDITTSNSPLELKVRDEGFRAIMKCK
jgi:hypothetical protein